MGQQASEKLVMAETFRYWGNESWGILLLAKYFANSEFRLVMSFLDMEYHLELPNVVKRVAKVL